MLNFYQIVKDNLSFNRFEYEDTVCLEYTCPIEAEQIGIFSKNDYIVYVLSGKKTYQTINGEWTVGPGQSLYLKKGAEVIRQYFDDEYCMLGFFLTDDLIKQTVQEHRAQLTIERSRDFREFTALEVQSTAWLDSYFHSMLAYFQGINRPPDNILVLKLKELLITIMNSDPKLAAYFCHLADSQGPSLEQIMEKNYCFNLKLEDYAELTHRSVSTFKRDFQRVFDESPGRWITKRRVKHAANLMVSSDLPISQIAFQSGFDDLSHFSRAFKSEMGNSPSDYKKSLSKA